MMMRIYDDAYNDDEDLWWWWYGAGSGIDDVKDDYDCDFDIVHYSFYIDLETLFLKNCTDFLSTLWMTIVCHGDEKYI